MDYNLLAEQLTEVIAEVYYKKPTVNYAEFFQGELKMLNLLSKCETGLTPGELCKRLFMTSARVASALKSVEKKGYVVRERDEKDRRSVIVTLTDRGREYAEKKDRELKEAFGFFLSELGEDDSREFIRLVSRLSEISDKRRKGE